MLRLSPSSIKLWQTCPAKWSFRYTHNLESKQEKNEYLSFGTAFHAGLDSWWQDRDESASKIVFDLLNGQANTTRVIGESLMLGYHHVYRNDGFTLLQSEAEVTVELKGIVELTGILDKLAIDPAGRRCIIEHKTTRSDISPSSRYWQSRILDTQVDMYYLISDLLELDIEYVLYDVIKIPQLRRAKKTPPEKQEFYKKNCKGGKKGDPKPGTYLTDESWEHFRSRVYNYIAANQSDIYVRQQMFRTSSDIAKTEEDIYRLTKMIEYAIDNNLYPRNMSSCFNYNSACEFLPVCCGETRLTNTELYQIREK